MCVGQIPEGITAIEDGDFPRVVEVWEASVRATHHFLTEDDLRQLEILVSVRDDDGRVVGFMGVEGVEVEALFIHPTWRGQGVGRRLLTYAIEALGASELDVNEPNDQAVGFYRRMGFAVAGRSAVDEMGLPFPVLHLRYTGDAGERDRAGKEVRRRELHSNDR